MIVCFSFQLCWASWHPLCPCSCFWWAQLSFTKAHPPDGVWPKPLWKMIGKSRCSPWPRWAQAHALWGWRTWIIFPAHGWWAPATPHSGGASTRSWRCSCYAQVQDLVHWKARFCHLLSTFLWSSLIRAQKPLTGSNLLQAGGPTRTGRTGCLPALPHYTRLRHPLSSCPPAQDGDEFSCCPVKVPR